MKTAIVTDFKELLATCKQKYNAGNRSWTPTTEEHYDYFLGVVPPDFHHRGIYHYFACGEPWKHNAAGESVHLCFELPCGAGDPPSARYATLHEIKTNAHLLICCFPCGWSYCDRSREKGGDYVRLAFQSYATLELEWDRDAGKVPDYLRAAIERQAWAVFKMAGEDYPTGGQSLRLGTKIDSEKWKHVGYTNDKRAIYELHGHRFIIVYDASTKPNIIEQPAENCKGKQSPDGEHDGYWINKAAGTFRCYWCQFQFSLREMEHPTPGSRIEVWEGNK